MTLLLFLVVWFVVSIVLAFALGRILGHAKSGAAVDTSSVDRQAFTEPSEQRSAAV